MRLRQSEAGRSRPRCSTCPRVPGLYASARPEVALDQGLVYLPAQVIYCKQSVSSSYSQTNKEQERTYASHVPLSAFTLADSDHALHAVVACFNEVAGFAVELAVPTPRCRPVVLAGRTCGSGHARGYSPVPRLESKSCRRYSPSPGRAVAVAWLADPTRFSWLLLRALVWCRPEVGRTPCRTVLGNGSVGSRQRVFL